MFEQVLSEIKKYNTIIIHRHAFPDGDAIGSQTGLKLILKENFPDKNIYAVGDDPKRYGFVKYCQPDVIEDEKYRGALAIILDTSAKSLISDDRYTLSDKVIKIDHHIYCEKIGDVEITDTSFESCAGLIACFAKECNLKVTKDAATAIYTGIVTDSGRFRFDSTTPETFNRAAFLLEKGIDLNEVYRNLYADDFNFIRLKAQFVLKIQFTKKNVAYIYTKQEELANYNAEVFTISRGMVGTMADLKGIDIWVNFTETKDGVLCELRSSKYNINQIAVKYGGGGHLKASGATVKDRETAMNMLEDLNNLIED